MAGPGFQFATQSRRLVPRFPQHLLVPQQLFDSQIDFRVAGPCDDPRENMRHTTVLRQIMLDPTNMCTHSDSDAA